MFAECIDTQLGKKQGYLRVLLDEGTNLSCLLELALELNQFRHDYEQVLFVVEVRVDILDQFRWQGKRLFSVDSGLVLEICFEEP